MPGLVTPEFRAAVRVGQQDALGGQERQLRIETVADLGVVVAGGEQQRRLRFSVVPASAPHLTNESCVDRTATVTSMTTIFTGLRQGVAKDGIAMRRIDALRPDWRSD